MHQSESGASLVELMAVMLIIAIAATVTMPLLQQQIATREIESVARRWIAHAQFARQHALHLGESIRLEPMLDGKWDSGWLIKSGCLSKFSKPDCVSKVWLSQGRVDPIFFRGGGRYFMDPHTGKTGILFNAAGAAKTAQGGFVANRLVLGHQRYPGLERQLILGSGGRWRICDPARDTKRCH
ncbi:GspH/FimT family pseudopilin [Polynucleobacter sp. MWH-UH23A]|uniref:pilus assembly FimT family protein n=1 Tax=Polynucleobacter sp. MWH-UH23A TaxID=1855613 RepID=UPI00336522C4